MYELMPCTPDQLYFYFYDGLGSVIALSNMSGQIVEWYDYDVFDDSTIYTGPGIDGIWQTEQIFD